MAMEAESALAVLEENALDKEDEADGRVCCDPTTGVSDLEAPIVDYMEKHVGYRNLHGLMDKIRDSGCTWKSGPQAGACNLMEVLYF